MRIEEAGTALSNERPFRTKDKKPGRNYPCNAEAAFSQPDGFVRVLGELPPGVSVHDGVRNGGDFDVIILFAHSQSQLTKGLKSARPRLAPAGGLWIAWPKKASGIATDLSENLIRELVLATGLVDNKVCAVDETWSGLHFVIRVADRVKTSDKRRS